MKNRFDLEDDILSCWNIVSDLRALSEAVCNEALNTDKIANILIGLEQLYDIKFNKAFCTLEQLIQSQFNKGKYEL